MPREHPIICLITDRARLAPGADLRAALGALVDQSREAVEAGVDVIQVRERDLDTDALVDLVHAIRTETRGSATRVVVNDRLDVAIGCAVDGVHLRSDSIGTLAARSIAPSGFLVGRSVHGPDEAARTAAGADYLIAGAVFPTRSKPPGHELLGLAGLAAIARGASIPVLAVGGLTLDRVQEVSGCGAAGFAAIDLFLASGTLAHVVQDARRRFDRVRVSF